MSTLIGCKPCRPQALAAWASHASGLEGEAPGVFVRVGGDNEFEPHAFREGLP